MVLRVPSSDWRWYHEGQKSTRDEDHDNDDDDGDDNPERSSKRFTQPVGGLRRCMSRGESSKAWQRKD